MSLAVRSESDGPERVERGLTVKGRSAGQCKERMRPKMYQPRSRRGRLVN